MARKIKLSPDEAAEKWSRRTSGATEDYKRGVDSVDESPGQRAADRLDAYRQGIDAALNSGKTERAMRAVDLNSWKDAAKNMGANRISQGVQAAEGKAASFYRELFQAEQELMDKVDKMDGVTLEDSVARARAWMEGMSDFARNR